MIDSLNHPILAILLFVAVLTPLVGLTSADTRKKGWSEAISILSTLIIVSLIDAFTSKKCEDSINKLIEEKSSE